MRSLRPVAIRIPGKLLLSGEYAVLDGAPAIVTCVDRYCDASAVPAEENTVTVTGPEAFTDGFMVAGDTVMWASGEHSPARTMLATLIAALPPAAPMSLTIDSSEFYTDQRKLGLGSSAAAAVAVGTVLAGASGYEDALQLVSAAHHAFQGGKGSGADVYAVALGGSVFFQRRPDGVSYRALRWPEGLLAVPVQAQVSASTVDRVTRYQQWTRAAAAHSTKIAQLASDAQNVAAAWRGADASALIDAIRIFTGRMLDVDILAGLGYTDGGHAQLLPAAEQCGVVYKPCGAGGGDFGVALATDDAALQSFAAQARQLGFATPSMSLINNAPMLRSI